MTKFSFSTWFTGVVVALLPALAFGHGSKSHEDEAKAKTEGKSSAAADIAESKAQFEHAERTQSTTRQTGLSADAQQKINPAEVEKTFGRQVSVVDLTSLTPDQSRALQQTLADRGYYHGKVDGVIGAGTRTAVSKLLAQQFALNQRFVRAGRVTEPFLAGLGVQASELAPVSGTDAAHVRPQAISPAAEQTPAVKHDTSKRARKQKAAVPDKSTEGVTTGEPEAGSTKGTSNTTDEKMSPDPLSDYWDQQG